MKTMFKKTLVAAALAGLSANAFAAADVTNSAIKVISKQGAIATVTQPALEVTLGAEYAVGDVITFSFSGGALKPATVANQLSVVLPDTNDVMTLGLLEATENFAKYRVTVLNKDGLLDETTADGVVTLTGLTFTGSAVLAADGVTFSYAAVTSNGLSLDTTGSNLSKKVIYVGDELSAKVQTKLNRKIDVTQERKFFTAATPNDEEDTLVIDSALVTSVDVAGGGTELIDGATKATVTRVAYTIKGDFSWIADDDADEAGVQPAAGTLTLSNCGGAAPTFATPVVTATQITFNCNAGNAATSLKFDIAQGAGDGEGSPVVLNTNNFTADALFTYTTNGGVTGKTEVGMADADAGSWTLNGSTVNVPYLAFGTIGTVQFSQVINVANNSAVEGDITVDVWAEDGTALLTNEKVAVAKANSTTNIAGKVRDALKNKKSFENGKVSLRIVTNVPEDSVSVYSAYTDVASRERAIVNNDSKVQTK